MSRGLDDGTRALPPNDLATLLHLAMQSIDIASLVPVAPVYSNATAGYNVYVTDLTYDSTSLTLTSIDGGVRLVAGLTNVQGDLLFDCTSGGSSLPCFNLDTTGGFSATSVTATSDLAVGVDGAHELEITTGTVDTQINGFALSADNAAVDSLLPFVQTAIVSLVLGDIEDQLISEAALIPTLQTQLVDGLIGAIAEGGLGEISIPPIDLSSQLGLSAGTAAVQVTTQTAGRQAGTIVVTGHL